MGWRKTCNALRDSDSLSARGAAFEVNAYMTKSLKHYAKTAKATALLLMLLVAACASPQPPRPIARVPDKLMPGANESLAMIVPAKGVQIYECRARKDLVGDYE